MDLICVFNDSLKYQVIRVQNCKFNDLYNCSSSSDAEFYKNLRKISGNDVLNKDEEQSEEEELSDDAARKLAENIGDLDDLDNNLFAGLGSAKKAKPEQKRGLFVIEYRQNIYHTFHGKL